MRAICLHYRPECGDCSHGIWHDYRKSCETGCELRRMDGPPGIIDRCFRDGECLLVMCEVEV